MRYGIKRWIIRYRFHRYKCQDCGIIFLPEEMGWPLRKFGPGIFAYSVYQNIGLRVAQETVDRSLNKLFGLDLAIGTDKAFQGEGS